MSNQKKGTSPKRHAKNKPKNLNASPMGGRKLPGHSAISKGVRVKGGRKLPGRDISFKDPDKRRKK